MAGMGTPVTRGAARGRLRGARVGAVMGAGWAIYGLTGVPPLAARLIGVALVLCLTLWLLAAAGRLARAAGALPGGTQTGEGRRTIWFLAIVAGEILLLNLAVLALSREPLHVYWIAAISFVVGLHFAPLAMLFRLRAFWGTAAAMILSAILAACAIRFAPPSAPAVNTVLALANALTLWITAGSGLADVRGAAARAPAPV